MAISYQIDDDILQLSLEGAITQDDVLAYRRDVRANPCYRPGMPELVDCRHMATLMSATELRALAASMERRATEGPWRCAVLVASDAVYGLARMYDAFVQDPLSEVGPFRDRDEAVAWLKDERPSVDDH